MAEADSIQDPIREDALSIRTPADALTIPIGPEPVLAHAPRGVLQIDAPHQIEQQDSSWLQHPCEFRELAQVLGF